MPEESGGCSGTASCQFKSAMEFAFADMIQDYKHAAARRRDVNDFISSQVQVAHLGEGIKVGTREAAAMQRMDADKSAGKLMEHTLALAAAKNA